MLLLVLLLTQGPQGPQGSQGPIALHSGQVITRSARVLRRTYRISGVVIRGDNMTVDFAGATLQGTPADTAIRIDGGKNVRIIQARARGYKVGILARGTRNLTLEDNDLSYNWKPRLFSLVEHESLVDWLSFHHNEKDEWLRFGAAIYLADVAGGKIVENGAVQGMNGLLVVRSNGLSIRGNNFSFNSGLGVGLYRSSYDTIVHNWIDYNVRGYSHGFYSRGQDSADLLIYEQSSHNVIAHNSLTHGGDGVFLWAGQTTMDSGSGGANDNLIDQNDVSYATANGVEATFSRTRLPKIAPGETNTACGAATASKQGSWAMTSEIIAPASRSSTGRTTSSAETVSCMILSLSSSGRTRSSLPSGAIRNTTTRAAATIASATTSSSAIA